MELQVRQEIAGTILSQLGGTNKLNVMIGAKNFSFGEKGELTFHFKMCKKANIIKIGLNGLDLYDITFYKYNSRKMECPIVKEFNNIYAEDMRQIIEEYTGLYLSLGTMGR